MLDEIMDALCFPAILILGWLVWLCLPGDALAATAAPAITGITFREVAPFIIVIIAIIAGLWALGGRADLPERHEMDREEM